MLVLLPLLAASQPAQAQSYAIGEVARMHALRAAPLLHDGVRSGNIRSSGVSHGYAQERLQDQAQRALHAIRLRTIATPMPYHHAPMALRPAPGSLPAGAEPVTGGKVAAEILVGALAGGVTSVAFAYVGAAIIGPEGGEDPGLVGAAMGFVTGATVGSALGVYGVGSAGEGQGSFAGSLVGSVLGMGLFMLLRPDPDSNPLFWAGVYGLPAAGATIGFNLARR